MQKAVPMLRSFGRMNAGVGARLFLAWVLACITTVAALAEPAALTDPTEYSRNEESDAVGLGQGSFIVAPVPFRSPIFGAGIALGGAFFFNLDSASDRSSVGGGAFRTENGSEGFGFGIDLNFASNLWTTKLAFADASLDYDLYLGGAPLAVSQTLRGVSFEVQRRVTEAVRAAVVIGYGESTIGRRDGLALPPQYARDRNFEVARFGLRLEQDTRDDTFYPTKGSFLGGTLTFGHGLGSQSRNYSKGVLTAKVYTPLFENGVLAAQGVLCAADDRAPFFDSCALGAVDAFRGYPSTEFIGDRLVSGQLEYRGRLTDRWGYVAFLGAGTIGGGLNLANDGDLRYAAGLGARFRLSKSVPVDYAVDVSLNDRGESLLYISLGQRF